jgi:hypothetical protein
MVELQGIHVAVVPITPKGGNDVTTKFEELPMSKSQNCYKIAPKDRHKQVSQFVRVKEDAQFGVKIKASDVDKWLMTNDRANAVLIEVTIDGGSLVQKELVMKKDVKSKITTINRFVHGEGKGVQIARAHFEQRNDRKCYGCLQKILSPDQHRLLRRPLLGRTEQERRRDCRQVDARSIETSTCDCPSRNE